MPYKGLTYRFTLCFCCGLLQC